jgi:RND family efflux transporter MFP subunit
MRKRNTIVVVLGIVAVVLIGLAAAGRSGGKALAVREATVKYQNFTTKLPETGVVQRPSTATIPAGVAGNVGQILVRPGDRVFAGQVLATIVNPQLLSNLASAEASAASAQGRAESAIETNDVLPAQNHSAVVQAQAAVVSARAQLVQAKQDLIAGAQSGLGYGGATADEQRLDADAAVSKAETDLREAKRLYDADQYLFAQRGLSRDQLLQAQARYEQAQVTYDQTKSQRTILEGTLGRNQGVLNDRVHAAENSLAQAQAALASAQAQAAQSKAGDVVAAKADAERAQSDLAFARDQVDRLQVRAPFEGVVLGIATQANDPLRTVQSGDTIQQGQTLFTLGKPGPFIVKTRVDEQDVAGVATGQRAIVSGEDFGGKKLAGHVTAISPLAQKSDDPSNTSRQILTTIALDQTLPFLRDGMTVDVDIITHDQPHALVVPIDALHSDDKGKFVFLVRDGRATRSDVKVSTQSDTSAVIASGLGDGDIVIADKNPAVAVGARVVPAPSASPGAGVTTASN